MKRDKSWCNNFFCIVAVIIVIVLATYSSWLDIQRMNTHEYQLDELFKSNAALNEEFTKLRIAYTDLEYEFTVLGLEYNEALAWMSDLQKEVRILSIDVEDRYGELRKDIYDAWDSGITPIKRKPR